jgi:hypothetical protein
MSSTLCKVSKGFEERTIFFEDIRTQKNATTCQYCLQLINYSINSKLGKYYSIVMHLGTILYQMHYFMDFKSSLKYNKWFLDFKF